MHRFYAPAFVIGADVELPDEEAQHLSRVLRMKPGGMVAVFDGKGREAMARVEKISARGVTVRAIEARSSAPEAATALTLAQALLKNDKMDRVIRDAVMLGVAAIQPLVSKRIDVPRSAVRSGARHERWDRTAISSAKQCGRAVVPPVLETRELDGLLASPSGGKKLMFVEPGATARVFELSSLESARPSEATIFIGPEGGWDPGEVDAASKAGVTLVQFGRRTLRADAAGAAVLAVLLYEWKDL